MLGVWYAAGSDCQTIITINKDNNGSISNALDTHNCAFSPIKGQVTFTKANLYIGATPLKFIVKPEMVTGNDSVNGQWVFGVVKYVKVYATMTLGALPLHAGNEVKFYKLVNN